MSIHTPGSHSLREKNSAGDHNRFLLLGNPWVHAAPVSIVVIGFYYYWFALANRYSIFLYAHLGAEPFDTITTGRYIMAGAVAGGFVLLGYSLSGFLLGRLGVHRFPAWHQVWIRCLPALLLAIPLIIMTQNWPTLPPALAAASTASALAGLAIALMPAQWAAGRPGTLALITVDGWGLIPPLLLLRTLEMPGKYTPLEEIWLYLIAIGAVLGGAAWLGMLTFVRRRFKIQPYGAVPIFLAGLSQSYLLLPLAHYLLFTPATHRYISAAANFFPEQVWLLGASLACAGALAWATARLRNRLAG